MRKRNTHINIRTTPDEKARFERNAKRCGLSLTEYLRKLANGYEPQPVPTEEYSELSGLLMSIYDDFRISGNEMYTNLIADTLLKLQATVNPVKRHGNN